MTFVFSQNKSCAMQEIRQPLVTTQMSRQPSVKDGLQKKENGRNKQKLRCFFFTPFSPLHDIAFSPRFSDMCDTLCLYQRKQFSICIGCNFSDHNNYSRYIAQDYLFKKCSSSIKSERLSTPASLLSIYNYYKQDSMLKKL